MGVIMKVLVADDEESIVYILKRVLTKSGCIVETATNGLELLKLWKIDRQMVVLSDVNMPRLGGIAACREIKKLNPRVHIFLMTGSPGSYDDALKAMLGPVIKKPFSLPELTNRVLAAGSSHSI